ncbi:hypothetical protein LUZ60_007102 [Juncus effusus]|nr:hypothetical protein LUZ60_007102 [Juncus effusus]
MAASLLLLIITLSLTHNTLAATGKTFQLEFHHRFSDKVQQWAESHGLPATWRPEEAPEGSAKYYRDLVRHDQVFLGRHGRSLSDSSVGDVYSFADGNETDRIPNLGYLHYAIVALGTPNQTFLVAMDTGSDIFWVPCNCKQCAPDTSSLYGKLAFSPNASSTSKEILCGSGRCDLPSNLRNPCVATSDECSYSIKYASYNTSSSGVLVEDVLYLTKQDGSDVQAPIIFGCGEVQTGSFLKTGATNGLMGLGMDNLSVPTMLAKQGLISDSFSMCFSSDGIGRLNFGDRGTSDQSETPFIIDSHNYPFYNISLTGIVIGNTTTDTSFTALVDSGTSFTILADPIYSQLTTTFAKKVKESRISDSSLPFEYCYQLSSSQTEVLLPHMNFTTKGGSMFPVLHPVALLLSETSQEPIGYCLAIMQSTNVNIIGQNFLTGLRIIFDRERMILGWKEFDCYTSVDSSKLPTQSNASATGPAAQAPGTIDPVATNLPSKESWAPYVSPSLIMSTLISIFLMVFILLCLH